MSFYGAVDAVLVNFEALLACLEADIAEDEDPVARGILHFVDHYQFLATAFMLKDVLNV